MLEGETYQGKFGLISRSNRSPDDACIDERR
jgi:hypothetical protein